MGKKGFRSSIVGKFIVPKVLKYFDAGHSFGPKEITKYGKNIEKKNRQSHKLCTVNLSC